MKSEWHTYSKKLPPTSPLPGVAPLLTGLIWQNWMFFSCVNFCRRFPGYWNEGSLETMLTYSPSRPIVHNLMQCSATYWGRKNCLLFLEASFCLGLKSHMWLMTLGGHAALLPSCHASYFGLLRFFPPLCLITQINMLKIELRTKGTQTVNMCELYICWYVYIGANL